MTVSGGFTYASSPHVAPRNGTGTTTTVPLPLQSDPRVMRGSTLAAARRIATSRTMATGNTTKFRPLPSDTTGPGHTYRTSTPSHQIPSRPSYTFEVAALVSEELNVSQYLVEAEAEEVVVRDKSSQVDELTPLPPPAPYVPRKTGVDVHTQVEDVWELFDFDAESAPLVDVIVRKTCEQALFEVQCEAELEAIQDELTRYEAIAAAEAAWVAEEEAKKRHIEMTQTSGLDSLKEQRRAQVRLMHTIAGRSMVRQLFPVIFEEAAKTCLERGAWIMPVQDGIQREIAPILRKNAVTSYNQLYSAKELMDEVLNAASTSFESLPSAEENSVAHSPERLAFVVRIQSAQNPELRAYFRFPVSADDTLAVLDGRLREGIRAFHAATPKERELQFTDPEELAEKARRLAEEKRLAEEEEERRIALEAVAQAMAEAALSQEETDDNDEPTVPLTNEDEEEEEVAEPEVEPVPEEEGEPEELVTQLRGRFNLASAAIQLIRTLYTKNNLPVIDPAPDACLVNFPLFGDHNIEFIAE